MQQAFETMVAAAVEAHPKSYDEREELAPGITLVYPKDGESLRENYDELTAYQFVTAAEAIGLNPSIGKGAYGHLLTYIGNQNLEKMAHATSPKKLDNIKSNLLRHIEFTSKRSSQDIIHETVWRRSYMEITLDVDTARDAVTEILRTNDQQFTPNMKRVLRTIFEGTE